MKHVIIAILLCLGLSITVHAQRKTPTTADATKVRLAAYLSNITSVTTISGGDTPNAIYSVTGTFTDPSSLFDVSNVEAGMLFLDGTCTMYRIVSITGRVSDVLTFRVSPIGNTAEQVIAPEPSLSGLVFDPTPNLLLPQWIYNMSSKLESCLFSHMANMIDRKLSTVASPSVLIKTETYTVASTDDTILFNLPLLSPATVTLPAANTANGKTYKIGKVDETESILTFSPAIKLSPSTSITTLNYARTFVVQSNGSEWWIVNQY